MDYTQYKQAVRNELLREAKNAWGESWANRFMYDKTTFQTALNLALQGSPVAGVIMAYSQTTAFGLKPLDSILKRPLLDEDLDDITRTTLQDNFITRKSNGVSLSDKDLKIDYGENTPNLDDVPRKLRHLYRARGLQDLPASHYATHVLRAVNRQDWARAAAYYQKLRQLDGRLFYDTDLYSRFLEELGVVIAERNPNFRFYWIKTPNGQSIMGYEVKKPRERVIATPESPDIESNGKPIYVNSFAYRKPKKINRAHQNGSNGDPITLTVVRRPHHSLERRVVQFSK